jgi:hypothetical protein
MRRIKVIADHHCFPLRDASPNRVGNTGAWPLPISYRLCAKPMAWAAEFALTLNLDEPANSGFENATGVIHS